MAPLTVIGAAERVVAPQPIHYLEAIVVVVLGLGFNVVCALILGKVHHDDDDSHEHDHHHDSEHHHDLNLKSAYVHEMADAETSVSAVVALAGG